MTCSLQQSLPTGLTFSKNVSGAVEPWHLVKTKAESYSSIHQQYWYKTVGRTLATFLDSARYSPQSQLVILYQFASLVAPHLGPSPVLGLPLWKSFMTDNHTPVELSWDFHTGTSRPTIRYSIEPISLDAGTVSNPYNDRAAADFRRDAVKAFPDTDTTLFDHFQQCFSRGWTQGNPEGHGTTMFWAFDLKENATTNKAYFFPGVVAHATNRSTLDVISDAFSSAPACSPKSIRSFDVFTDFVNQHQNLDLEIDMLALDLVRLEKSRLKIYFRDRRTDFNAVKEVMSLDGKLQGHDFDKGIRNLKRLWGALLDTDTVAGDVSLPHRDHRTAGILYNIEFRADNALPKVKVYIPVRHYAKSDLQIIGALKGFLTDQVSKQPDIPMEPVFAKQYSDCLQSIL
ncbi:hypothetical protein FSARC_12290 [Fusarium sarcochroum]|uniref:Aromatic prenyltransferase n=1 Tax=Fusarium sarcochroum TaxID=1208366 RepID=A0A8H4T9U8_9HYPO|nr:hypothetical protein FSARC_12290 [Fusarium sarcochroum]